MPKVFQVWTIFVLTSRSFTEGRWIWEIVFHSYTSPVFSDVYKYCFIHGLIEEHGWQIYIHNICEYSQS